MIPIIKLNEWLEEEKIAGASDPQQAILATIALDATPHSRVIAVREISSNGFLFFTQEQTRKVQEIKKNPHVSLNFWFELTERQVVVEGIVEKLTETENQHYWITYSRVSQLRFYAYAPTSSQEITTKQLLEEQRKAFEKQFDGQEIPMHQLYCGYRIKPKTFLFYAFRTDELSDVFSYREQDGWKLRIMSP